MHQLKWRFFSKHRFIGLMLLLVAWFLMLLVFLPPVGFNASFSTVVFDRNGNLLGAQIASDGQWRFSDEGKISDKFRACLLQYEDRHFYRHTGFNPISLFRAARQNISTGKVVSGGSTITMQMVRLSRQNKPRTITQKIIEIILSVHAEIHYSKSEILNLYSSHAPFGGNVVGLEAASWRYFGRDQDNLSWGEAACLAVLPNAPALIHPGRNREILKQKRNSLLHRLHDNGIIDSLTYRLACDEPLPDKPLPLPGLAPHLVAAISLTNRGERIYTTIDLHLQKQVNHIVDRHHQMLAGNRIHNAAVLVIDLSTGETMVYVGNTQKLFPGDHANRVDIIQRPRSSGSLLKPILFAAMLSEGEILPNTLIADIPTTISSFTPKNFNVTYDGAVPAREALIRSLNIPAVRMLSDFGQPRFYQILRDAGFTTIQQSADHYGLSLILGGAEVTLWDVCTAYRAMALKLLNHQPTQVQSRQPGFFAPTLMLNEKHFCAIDLGNLDEAAIFLTLDAMKDVRRPDVEAGWESFLNAHPIAWKTGTSFGFRDAWAVGITPDHVVGVWAGNASGEGRPGLIGGVTAAPLMFDVFSILPKSQKWFGPPLDEMTETAVCRQSGMRPSPFCVDIDTVLVNETALNAPPCPYHKLIHLDAGKQFRVTADCYPADQIFSQSWFELPPAMAWYYRFRNPFYRPTPPWMTGCSGSIENPMQLIWPDKPSKIFLPRQMDGSLGEIIFEIAHKHPSTTIFWYLDDDYLGETAVIHKKGLQPSVGKHQLILMDEYGNIFTQPFEVAGR
jgi:penicillin-binding protein 1C